MLERISHVTAEEYLGYFDDLGYRLAIIDQESWEPISFPTVEALLSRVEDRYQIENVLLTPAT